MVRVAGHLRMTRLDLDGFLGLTQKTVSRGLSDFNDEKAINVHDKAV